METASKIDVPLGISTFPRRRHLKSSRVAFAAFIFRRARCSISFTFSLEVFNFLATWAWVSPWPCSG